MPQYQVPKDYYFRLHHVRPRFKSDIENVLIYVAEEIVEIGVLPTEEFVEKLNNAIRNYPGNAHREIKTINNWRTEISALFGFIEHSNDEEYPGRRAKELAKNQDLVSFFKTYLYCFQYPGAHIKSQEVAKQIQAGIHFKPAQYLLKLLRYASEQEGRNVGITKAEFCHCVFNDLRCTRDNQDVSLTWKLIKENRENRIEYDQSGDVVRYAGDIIDYMEIANLLTTYDNRTFYINSLEEEAVIKFIESTEWFSGYDALYTRTFTLQDVNAQVVPWFSYVNRDMSDTDFSTDVLTYIARDAEELRSLQEGVQEIRSEETPIPAFAQEKVNTETVITERIENDFDSFGTKDIGDIGEALVHGHECMRIKLAGREDLIHLIKRIPTQFAVGYDISSVEVDERKRYIEVKTTISSKPLHFNKIHLTRNEWNTATTTKDRYFVYRLLISKKERKLFLIQDPVGLYKRDLIEMVPNTGADITFDPEHAGHFEELLTWQA